MPYISKESFDWLLFHPGVGTNRIFPPLNYDDASTNNYRVPLILLLDKNYEISWHTKGHCRACMQYDKRDDDGVSLKMHRASWNHLTECLMSKIH